MLSTESAQLNDRPAGPNNDKFRAARRKLDQGGLIAMTQAELSVRVARAKALIGDQRPKRRARRACSNRVFDP
jgi:hypothetical protein